MATDEIVGVRFTALSAEQIRQISVTHVDSHEMSERLRDKSRTLGDPAMGPTSDPSSLCLSCGENASNCCGHFGHLDLAKPVWNPVYLSSILKILRVICWECSKPRIEITETIYEKVKMLKLPQARLKYFINNSKSATTCVYCKSLLSKYTFKKKDGYVLQMTPPKKNVSPDQTFEVLRRINSSDCEIMGLGRPESMIFSVLPIPPPVVRPQILLENNSRSEEPLTFKLADIVRSNAAMSSESSDKSYRALQFFVASYIDSDGTPCPKDISHAVRKSSDGVSQRVGSKDGRVRGNIMGGRVDKSARSVISNDPNIGVYEVKVPRDIIKKIYYCETVTEENIEWLQTVVDRGPDDLMGARNVFKFPNYEIDLKTYVDGPLRKLQVGDRVERYFRDGEYVHLNRQPSLHGPSIQGHRIRIHDDQVIRINTAVCPPYNADFDGDEMNLHFPQSYQSKFEVRDLMGTKQQIISLTNSSPIIYMIQDTILGVNRLLLALDIKPYEFASMCNAVDVADDGPLQTGREVFSLILPPLSAKIGDCVIKDGLVVSGSLNKSTLASGHGSLVHRIHNTYGPERCCEFIFKCQKLAATFLKLRVFSIGPQSINMNPQIKQVVSEMYLLVEKDVESFIQKSQNQTLPLLPGLNRARSLEYLINRSLNSCINAVMSKVKNLIPHDNEISQVVRAKSRASEVNLIQSGVALFQQNVDGMRPKQGWTGRTLSHFPKFVSDPCARGFVINSLASGLNGTEFVTHSMASRHGLIDTAVKTGETGYGQRRMTKGMENVCVFDDLTVRDGSSFTIVQFNYGGNSFNPSFETKQQFWVAELPAQKAGEMCGDADVFCEGFEEEIGDTHQGWHFPFKCYFPFDEIRALGRARKWVMKYLFPAGKPFLSVPNINWILDSGMIPKGTPRFTDNVALRDEYILKMRDILPSLHGVACPIFEAIVLQDTIWKRVCGLDVNVLWSEIWEQTKRALVEPGTCVGLSAAFALGEPSTQLTLNTFHATGNSSGQNSAINRFKEIINVNRTITCPMTRVFVENGHSIAKVKTSLTLTSIDDIVSECQQLVDPTPGFEHSIEDKGWVSAWQKVYGRPPQVSSPFVVRLKIKVEKLTKYVRVIDELRPLFTDTGEIFAIDRHPLHPDYAVMLIRGNPSITDHHSFLRFESNVLKTCICGVAGNCIIEKVQKKSFDISKGLTVEDEKMLIVQGNNIVDIMCVPGVDKNRTTTNDIHEISKVLGIEAARAAIETEINEILDNHSMFVNPHHTTLMSDMMTNSGCVQPITRFGINRGENSVLLKCSFEETCEMCAEASAHNVSNNISCSADSIFFGLLARVGSGSCDISIDPEKLKLCGTSHDFPEESFMHQTYTMSEIPQDVMQYLS